MYVGLRFWIPLLWAVFAHAQSEPAKTSKKWESTLGYMRKEAAEVVRRRCEQDAHERVFETIEGVRTIFLRVDSDYAFQDIFIYTGSGGINFSPLRYNFRFFNVEVDAATLGSEYPNPDSLPVAAIKDYKPQFRALRKSFITVSYRRETTDEEQALGVYGRTIKVIDERKKTVLGERTEFFWLSPPGFRYGIRQGDAICPFIGPMQKSPEYFVGKVINPKSNPCPREFSEAYEAVEASINAAVRMQDSSSLQNLIREKEALFPKSWACWDAAKARLEAVPE